MYTTLNDKTSCTCRLNHTIKYILVSITTMISLLITCPFFSATQLYIPASCTMILWMVNIAPFLVIFPSSLGVPSGDCVGCVLSSFTFALGSFVLQLMSTLPPKRTERSWNLDETCTSKESLPWTGELWMPPYGKENKRIFKWTHRFFKRSPKKTVLRLTVSMTVSHLCQN